MSNIIIDHQMLLIPRNCFVLWTSWSMVNLLIFQSMTSRVTKVMHYEGYISLKP